MDTQSIKFIEGSLSGMDSATTWSFLTLMVIALSQNNSANYEFGVLKIEKRKGGVAFYIILCAINFHILRLLQLLWSNFSTLTSKSSAEKILQNNTWVFNPFTHTYGFLSYVTDNLGLPLLIGGWWLGLVLVNREIVASHKNKKSVFNVILFFLYVFEGVSSLILIIFIQHKVADDIVKYIFLVIGVVGGGFLYYYYRKNGFFLKETNLPTQKTNNL